MSLWRSQILPRAIDVVLGTEGITKWRRRCLAGLEGVVVEPGFGSGLNVPHYPDEVTKVYAIDPAKVGWDLAQRRIASRAIPVEYIGLDGARIDLDDDSCDAGLLTFTLCTIPDHHQALAELHRVIRPGGKLHFLEHGLAPDPNVQRWQHRATPIQRRLGDGCHLNRRIVADIEAAGFTVGQVHAAYTGRPKAASWFSVGAGTVEAPAPA